MDGSVFQNSEMAFPGWIPGNVTNYLMHTVRGVSIRELARQQGCHASTILRQVRRIESRRDDPLVDAGLLRLSEELEAEDGGAGVAPSDAELEDCAVRILRRLCESGAVLAVAADMPNGIVMRGAEGGAATRTAVVTRALAQAMALLDWISCASNGAIARYHVSATGRAALGQLVAAGENRARIETEGGFAEAPAPFLRQSEAVGEVVRRNRFVASESPLIALSRRRDKDGKRFLDSEMVRAGERLREDFELAQMDKGQGQRVLSTGSDAARPLSMGPDATAVQRRLAHALEELGPGLADVALQCCCYLEGLERTEKRMGWSARSGKIVLRIALQRLSRHYQEAAQAGGDLIG